MKGSIEKRIKIENTREKKNKLKEYGNNKRKKICVYVNARMINNYFF